jgi:hypothetical protein
MYINGKQKAFKDDNDNEDFKTFKLHASPQEFCKKGSECFTEILGEAYSYKYMEAPNYQKLRDLMNF